MSVHRVLVAHFRRRLLQPEDAAAGSTVSILPVMALLAGPAVLAPFLLLIFDIEIGHLRLPVADVRRIAADDRLFFVMAAMTLTGLVTLLMWSVLFPDVVDYRNLRPLPVRARSLFFAKLSALAGILAGFYVAACGVPALLAPILWVDHAGLAHPLRAAGAFVASTLAGSAFVFFALAACQGLLQALLPPHLFRRASAVLQGALLLLLLLLFSLRGIVEGAWRARLGSPAFTLPPLWFASLHEALLGTGDANMARLAREGLVALSASAVLFALAYALSWRRYVSGTLETPHAAPNEPSRSALIELLARAFRHPESAEMFRFTLRTLARSARHRLVVAAGAAIGVALSTAWGVGAHGTRSAPSTSYLAVPLVQIFCLAAALRMALSSPVEEPASWIFRVVPLRRPRFLVSGTRAAALLVAVAPPAILAAGVGVALHGAGIALLQLVFDAAAGALLVDLLLARPPYVPLVSPALDERLHATAFPWLVGFFVFTQGGAAIERSLLRRPLALLAFAALLVVLRLIAGRLHRRRAAHGFESAPDALPTMGLHPHL